MPIWIQTAAAPACTGWYVQAVPPQFTRCSTHRGEPAAAGAITCDGRPAAIFGRAWRMPSSTHSTPKPIRSTARPVGSASLADSAGLATRAPSHTRAVPHNSHSNAMTTTAISA
jgi:hypothetical protein